jgi:hypothetical protein
MPFTLKETGLNVRVDVDDVAGNIWQALLEP